MSNNHKKIVTQIPLIKIIQQDSKMIEIAKTGSLNFSEEFAMVMSRCFSNSGLGAVVFANRMTEKLNRGFRDDPVITPDKIRSWNSPAKTKYALKAWELPAFCEVACSEKQNEFAYEPIEFLVRKIRHFMMKPPEALRSRKEELREEIKEKEEEIKEIDLCLKLQDK